MESVPSASIPIVYEIGMVYMLKQNLWLLIRNALGYFKSYFKVSGILNR